MKRLLCLLLLVLTSCATTQESADQAQSKAHYELGLSFMREENYQKAFVEFQKSIRANPDNKLALNALGLIYLKFEDLDNAEQAFLDALDVDDEYSEAHNNLGVIYSKLKKWNRAAEQFKEALRNPMYASPERAYYNLGNVYYRMKKYRLALEQYRQAVRRAPAFYPAYYGMALCYNMIERYGDAAASLNDGIRMDPEIKGDRQKAADVFNARRVITIEEEERKDYQDLLEILNY